MQLIQQGWRNSDIARDLDCDPDTVTRWRREHEAAIKEQADSSPHLLQDVVRNIVESLQNLDDVRANAWRIAQRRNLPACDVCDRDDDLLPESVRISALNTVLKAESERAKILGLIGAKPEVAALLLRIKKQSEALMAFMRDNLCAEDRRKLERFVVEQFADDLSNIESLADVLPG